jgi:dipeptidyl aminopeptidase/acylaminoacyl peptidase
MKRLENHGLTAIMQPMAADTILDQLLTLPEILDARLSPDGRRIAFVWYRLLGNADVFYVPADASKPPVALTHTPEATGFVSWTPDSCAVIVAEDHEGDEHRRLFRVDLDQPGKMVSLTEDRPPYYLRGGSLHPDGKTLFYGANYDFAADHLIESTWLYRHDLDTGSKVAIARPTKPNYMVLCLNSLGTHLLYSRKDIHPGGRQFHLVDVNGGEDREILNFGDRVKVFARWMPDGENILVLSESTGGRTQEHNSLGIYHFPNGEMRWLIDNRQRSLESAWPSPDGMVILDEIIDATHKTSVLDPHSGVKKAFPALPGNLIPLGCSATGDWIARYYSATMPGELVRFKDGVKSVEELQSLTHVWRHTDLDPKKLTAAEPFRWHSVDGIKIQGWLYRALPNLKRAVIRIHGGPSRHAEDAFDAQIQYLVQQGFNVLCVNYRGSTGFGLKFREAIKEDGWGGREQSDIASAAEALIRAGLARAGRVGVTGTSFGGYSAWHLITHYPREIIAAAAPVCGMADLVTDYETTRPDLRSLTEEMMGGRPDQLPEKYFARSPINFFRLIQGSLFIVQGGKDPNVTPQNLTQIRQCLDAYDIQYEQLVFEDEGHGIDKPANQEILYTRLADFFERALR